MTNSQLIIETALLLLVAFLAGCAIGYLLRRASVAPAARAVPTTPPKPVAPPVPVAPVVAQPAPTPVLVVAAEPAAPVASPEPTPVAAAPRTASTPPKRQTTARAKAPAKPAAKPVAAMPADDGRPQGLSEPRGGKKDDLKQLKGIGPKIETTLNGLGIYHFDQIAAWDRKTIAWVDNHLAFSGRIDREQWVEQARARSN